jgi:exopolysaccharide biosynthesis polyprenyl glycosylphosphotransferase
MSELYTTLRLPIPGGQKMSEELAVGRLPATVDLDSTSMRDCARRVGDLIIASGLIFFTLPLMAIVAMAIKCESRGPIFYRQERVGLRGASFMLTKFRSMVENAEDGRRPVWAAQDDTRVTAVGSIIRRFRIDELPQLFNVLKGEMSIIGPRPERPYFVEKLSALIPGFDMRHQVKPGITGWAQVNYPYGASVEDARNKLTYDLYYIENRSPSLDLRILLTTVRVVVLQQGAR